LISLRGALRKRRIRKGKPGTAGREKNWLGREVSKINPIGKMHGAKGRKGERWKQKFKRRGGQKGAFLGKKKKGIKRKREEKLHRAGPRKEKPIKKKKKI